MRFAKGHGTENDFVILPDPAGELDLTPEFVRRLCDRRAGIGGDGVLRVVEVEVLAAELTEGGPGGFRISGERAGGLGAAGSTALAPPAALPAGGAPAAAGPGEDQLAAQWFMDYWNADGSIAEMCGNGARVFARYLLDHGLAQGPEFAIETRGGTRQVRVEGSGGITGGRGAPGGRGAG